MSDNIAFRFSNWGWDQYPLTADKYINWVADMRDGEDFMVVGMNYGALGINNHADSGIFEFFKALPYQAMIKKVNFMTPSEVIAKSKNDDVLTTGEPISWADEEKDLSAWNGNDLQGEALQKLYAVSERVRLCTDRAIKYDWLNLQACDNFYYMSTKHFAGNTIAHTGPYESPYEAFMNYMNILSDFLQRVDEQYPTTIDNEELNSLLKTINNQESQIVELEEEIAKLKAGKKPAKAKEEPVAPKAKAEPKPKKAAAKKTTKK
jgi:alpha-amylase